MKSTQLCPLNCLAVVLAVVLTLALTPLNLSAASHTLRAEKISAENIDHRIRGSAAIAGIDDWLLSNGTLCASFSATHHETYLSAKGGTLIDLGHCGRKDDQWHTYHEMFNMDQDSILPGETIEAFVTENSATLEVAGSMEGFRNITRYTLNTDSPDRLFIETSLTRVSRSDASLSLFGALTLHPHRSLTPFVLDTEQFKYSKGFHHPFANTHDKLSMLKVMFPANLHVLVGAAHVEPEISYGIHINSAELIDEENRHYPLKHFAINDDNFTLLGNFTNPLWFNTTGQPGLPQFIQTLVMDLDVNETLLLKKSIIVSDTADVASITDKIFSGTTFQQSSQHPDNRLLLSHPSHGPITYIKPNASGNYVAKLPAQINRDEIVAIESGVLDSIETGELILPSGQIMHLTFKGIGKTADPVFPQDNSLFSVGNRKILPDTSSNRISLAASPEDKKSVTLPTGQYKIYASRGIEFSVTTTELTITPNSKHLLEIPPPQRAINTDGWLNGDFHLHSALSFDSTFPPQQRVIDFVAQGGEVMVSSEHKNTVDFSQYIEQLDLQEQVVAIPGVELTGMTHTEKSPYGIGHHNVFPVEVEENAFLGGTHSHEGRRLGNVIVSYKHSSAKQNIFQLNHPRGSGEHVDDLNFFDHLSIGQKFMSNLPLSHEQNHSLLEKHEHHSFRDIDFDAIELLNGYDLKNYKITREDWFALIKQNFPKTATANSDSHNARSLSAIPRNYIKVQNDSLDNFNQEEFIASVKNGQLFFSTGPFIDAHLNQKRLGETFRGKSATLNIEIRTSNWVNVNTITVFINGVAQQQKKITDADHYSFPLEFVRDSFINIEVSGKPGSIYQALYPGFTPIAFTNPIWVDADNNQTLEFSF